MGEFTVSSNTLNLKKKESISVTIWYVFRKNNESHIKLDEFPMDVINLNGNTAGAIKISKGKVVTLLPTGKDKDGRYQYTLTVPETVKRNKLSTSGEEIISKPRATKKNSPAPGLVLSNDF